MKTPNLARPANHFLVLAALLGLSAHADAATNNWNTTTGAWDTSTANWLSPTTWTNGDDAVFSFNNTASIVTLSSGLTAGSVTVGNGGNNANYTFTGGSLSATSFTVRGDGNNNLGNNPTAAFNNTSITLSGALNIGRAYLNITGNSSVSADTIASPAGGDGPGAWGTLTIADTASVTATNGFSIGTTAWGLNLNGGTLTTKNLSYSPHSFSGTTNLNFNGTLIKANQDNTNFIVVGPGGLDSGFNPNIQAGGAKFDTNGFTIGIGVAMQGTGALTKSGSGTLTLSGGANTFTGGVTVEGGTLVLSKGGDTNSIAGDNAVEVKTGGTLRLGQTGQIAETIASFTLNGGTFDLDAYTEGFNPAVTMTNGTITGTSVGFILARGGYIGTGTNTISQRISVRAGDANSGKFDITSGITEVSGVIYTDSGAAAGITKTGAGTLRLSGANSYAGVTTISTGVLSIAGTGSLPGWDTNGKYSVASGATLAVGNAVTNGNITTMLGTTNFAAGSSIGFDTTSGDRTHSTAIANTGQGALGLTKIGVNTLNLTVANSYTGGTIVNGGTLSLNYEPAGISNTAIGAMTSSNTVTINNGGTLTGTGNNWLSNTALASGGSNAISVIVNQGGTLKGGSGRVTGLGNVALNGGTIEVSSGLGAYDWNASFTLGGDITVSGSTASAITTSSGANTTANIYMANGSNGTGGTRTFTVNDVTNSAASDLVVSAQLAKGTVIKAGAGTLEMATGATGTETAVSWQVDAGKLQVNNTVSVGAATVNNGGTLAIGTASAAGAATIGGNLNQNAGSIFEWSLASNTTTGAGTNFDSVNVTGNLAIDQTETTGALFKIVLGTAFNGGDAFWLADQAWDIFTVSGSSSTEFKNFALYNASNLDTPVSYESFGSFTYTFASGTGTGTLNWTAVPEPTSAMAGLLLGAGLLRRRRRD